MGKFLRENWVWILAPIAIVMTLFVVILLTSSSEGAPDFVCKIF